MRKSKDSNSSSHMAYRQSHRDTRQNRGCLTKHYGSCPFKLGNFKSEVASSLNINLKQGYNGDLTSREAGSIGGEMVKRMIEYAEKNMH